MLIHWKRPHCWERLRAGEGSNREEMVGWHHWLNGQEFEQTLGDREWHGSLVCCSPCGRKESDTTEWLNWTDNSIAIYEILSFLKWHIRSIILVFCSHFQIFSHYFYLQALFSSHMDSHQFSSVTLSCPTLCDHMDCSTPGFPVHHQLPELAQTHFHRASDAISDETD